MSEEYFNEEIEHSIKPKKYQLTEDKKQELLSNILNAKKEMTPNKQPRKKIVPVLGLISAAALAFLLFAPQIFQGFNIGSSDTPDQQPPDTIDDPPADNNDLEEPTIKELFNSEEISVELLKTEFIIREEKMVFSGNIGIEASRSLLNKFKGEDYRFIVSLSGDDETVSSEDLPVEAVFRNDLNSSLIYFDTWFDEENLPGDIVTISLDLLVDANPKLMFVDRIILDEHFNIGELVAQEKEDKRMIDQYSDEELIQLGKEFFVEYLEQLKNAEPMLAISNYRIENMAFIARTSDGFTVHASYSLLPKYPNEYALAGNGIWPDNKGWVLEKSQFVDVKYENGEFEIKGIGTGP